jgi:para-nitrobenzyl esterase
MIAAFAGLARNGAPGLKDWTPYSLPDRDTLVIGQDRIMVQSDPRQWERELWATGQYIQPGG